MISVGVSDVTVAFVVPKWTEEALARLVPKMSTMVPPESGPEEGLIEVTEGVSNGGTVVVVVVVVVAGTVVVVVEVVGRTVVVVVVVTMVDVVVLFGAMVVVVVGGEAGRPASEIVSDKLVDDLAPIAFKVKR